MPYAVHLPYESEIRNPRQSNLLVLLALPAGFEPAFQP